MNRDLELAQYQITDLIIDSHVNTSIDKNTLYVNSDITDNITSKYPELTEINLQIFTSKDEDMEVNTIMDTIPIRAKHDCTLGTGKTFELSGVVTLLTGREASGKQVAEFGSTAGRVGEKIAFNQPGCPDESELIFNIDMTIEEGIAMTRDGPTACHRATDEILQEIRQAIKADLSDKTPDNIINFTEGNPHNYQGMPTVMLVKEMMGQGGMHDNVLLPLEPCGVTGGKSVVDLGNIPVTMSPNEMADGGIHAMTCVGPSTKETTRHYARDPLLYGLYEDNDLFLSGVITVGSPQSDHEKAYVAERLGMIMEQTRPDGVIVMTEGFGNNHIDFANHIKETGKRQIPVVGVTYAAKQGALVIGNEYMDALIELNKSETMFETEVLAENTLTSSDAHRAINMLKKKIFQGGTNVISEVPVPQQPPHVWTEPPQTLSNTKVALVSAAGIHLKDQEPFNVAGDNTYRQIPGDIDSDKLTVTHGGYDHKDVRKNINCMFPVDRLQELSEESVIGGLSDYHIGFMGGGGDFDAFSNDIGPEIAEQLKKARAGAAILTAG